MLPAELDSLLTMTTNLHGAEDRKDEDLFVRKAGLWSLSGVSPHRYSI
jgi:hypothetical protein